LGPKTSFELNRPGLQHGSTAEPEVQRGFTLIELLVVVAIIGVLAAIAIPQYQRAILKAEISAVAAESKTLYTAFKQHYIDLDLYPYASASPAFQLDTFEPLVSLGYYRGGLQSKLLNGRADAFDSPDDQGQNREFWLEMSLRKDPTVRFLIADSDDAPLAGGNYVDGIYLYRNGVLKPFHDPD
jgi:prepilin-type N-terminal cleavage/methylation domain-containing protein